MQLQYSPPNIINNKKIIVYIVLLNPKTYRKCFNLLSLFNGSYIKLFYFTAHGDYGVTIWEYKLTKKHEH